MSSPLSNNNSAGHTFAAIIPSSDRSQRQAQIRSLAEDLLSFRFYSTWQRHVETLTERENLDPEDRKYLTERERFVLGLGNYRSLGIGTVVAITSFGTIMGFNMWRRKGSALFTPFWQRIHSQQKQPPAPSPKAYINLDRIAGKRKPTASKKTNSTRDNNGPLLQRPSQKPKQVEQTTAGSQEAYTGPSWNTVWIQIESMISAAVAVILGVTTSFYIDTEKMYTDLEKLPLEAGRSHLTNKACPDLIQLYQQLVLHDTPTRHWKKMNQTNLPGDRTDEAFLALESKPTDTMQNDLIELQQFQILQLTHDQDPDSLPTDQELWSRPQTRQLEAMIRLTKNCQQRMQFMKDEAARLEQMEQQAARQEIIKVSEQEEILMNMMGRKTVTDTAPGVVRVPEPGVPPTYLGMVVSEDQNEEDGNIDGNGSAGFLETVFPERAARAWRLVLY